MCKLVVKGLGKIIGDEAVVYGEILATILHHLPPGQVASEAIHDCEVKFFGQRYKQIVLG